MRSVTIVATAIAISGLTPELGLAQATQPIRNAAAGLQDKIAPLTAGPKDPRERVAPGKIDADASRDFKETKSGLKYRVHRHLPVSVLAAQEPMQPKHVARLSGVLTSAISPEGKQIAYTLSKPREPLEETDGPARSHLYVADLAGNTRPFITGDVSVGSPHWSNDGGSIYYVAKRNDDEHACIYRIPIDGGESVKVLEHETAISGFSLHPDGKRVAFLAPKVKSEEERNREEQGFNQQIYEEDWTNTCIWLTTLDHAVPNDGDSQPRMLDLPGSASALWWNNAGDKLAVILAPTPSVDDSYMAKQVHVVDADAGQIVGRVEHAAKLGSVAWSPDDQWLAMIAGRDIHDPSDGRLMVTSVSDPQGVRDWMPDYDAHVTSFAWLDESELIWTADEGTRTRVGKVDRDGKVTTLIEPEAGEPILSQLTVSENGRQAALVGHGRTHPTEIFALNLETNATQRLSHSNPWLKDLQLARQETISWKAKDGLELQGVLVYPLGYQAGRRYPMIMVVHGGPEAHVADGWVTSYSRPGQVSAGRDFFVFYPNYRGSTGRGVEFSMMGQADAANKEFSDLIDGVQHLVSEGLVSEDRVGITGGSYGGYASAWGATYYSEHFAASVMFVGISDNVSKVGTTDIPEEMFLVHHRKRLWDDWEYFLNSSPIRYVERNRTPTLIMHGKEDPRVHPSQSLELFRHLKTLGQAPVRLVLYEGEGHGNRKAAARLDYNLRLLRWMDHYLKGPGGDAPDYPVDYQAALDKDDSPSE